MLNVVESPQMFVPFDLVVVRDVIFPDITAARQTERQDEEDEVPDCENDVL